MTLGSGFPVDLKAKLISEKASFILAATATEAVCAIHTALHSQSKRKRGEIRIPVIDFNSRRKKWSTHDL